LSKGNQYVSGQQIAVLKAYYDTVLDLSGSIGRAESVFLEAIEDLESGGGNNYLLVVCLHDNVRMIYRNRDELEVAEEYCLKALKIFEENQGAQSEPVATMLNNIDVLYQAASLLDRAVEMHMRVRDIRLTRTGPHSMDTGHIATTYHSLEKSEEAAIYYLRAIRALADHQGTELYQINEENFEILKEQYPGVRLIPLTEEFGDRPASSLMEMPL
jgi:tetratricopeptide (TPR) repeat protein